jgi:hypothetical protein
MNGRRVTSFPVLERIARGLGAPREALGMAAAPDPAEPEL